MTPEEKQAHHLGPGGYKCRCCGPAPKARKQHRRTVRRRVKATIHRTINNILREE
jgi:hypothetical protein